MNWNNHAGAAVTDTSGGSPGECCEGRRSAAGIEWNVTSCDIRQGPTLLFLAAAALILFITISAPAAEPKRVLIVNSWGIPAPPSTIHSTTFESEIVARLGERINVDAVALDLARNEEGELQLAMVDYLEKRQANWKPDLVVPIGSPAAIFVANYYDRLFPEAPVLVIGSNRAFLPAGSWEKNSAFVGHAIEIPAFFEDMLRLAPTTKNIEIVLGATSLERLGERTSKRRLLRSRTGSISPTTTTFPSIRCWSGPQICRRIPSFSSWCCCGMPEV